MTLWPKEERWALYMWLSIALLLFVVCGCAPARYALPGRPGWTVQESAIPVRGLPDEPPEACGPQRPGQEAGPPRPPCGFTDATTDCASKTVTLWWYARPGALDHEMIHVEECR